MPFLSVLWQLARNLECKLKLGWAKGHTGLGGLGLGTGEMPF